MHNFQNVIINNSHLLDVAKFSKFVNYLANNDEQFKKMGARADDLTHIHTYTDNAGNLLFFKPRFKNDKGKWIKPCYDTPNFYRLGLPEQIKESNQKPLYNLGLINSTPKNTPVYIVEGEKCADSLCFLGFVATTTGGATSSHKFDFSPLNDRTVIIWADYDKSGNEWEREIYNLLAGKCAVSIINKDKIRLANNNILGEYDSESEFKGYDSADYIDEHAKKGLNIADIYTLILELETFTPTPPTEPKPITATNEQDGYNPMAGMNSLSSIPLWKYNDTYTGYFAIFENQDIGGEIIHGLYFIERDKNDEVKPYYICSPLFIRGLTRDKAGENWGRLLEFSDLDGKPKRWAMPIELVQGDGREYRKVLSSKGLIISPRSKARNLLDIYLQSYPCLERIICVNSIGWQDGLNYTLPNRTFGNAKIIMQAQELEHGYSEKNTLTEWQRLVSLPCSQHSRLAFALCVAFAGQLLTPLQSESMGFHFVGQSSMGKSLSIQMACSVWGDFRHFMRTWKATGNGLESVASVHNDSFLALDEISEISDKQAGDIVYMLGNGTGKTRMTKDGTGKDAKKWKIAYLSTGEKTLKEIMQNAGETIKAGQEIRLIHINADAGAGLGMFNVLHDIDPATQAQNYKKNAGLAYGVAGMAWLDFLVKFGTKSIKNIKDEITKIMLDSYPNLSPQKRRVFENFALVATAGELATMAGVTGWNKGQAIQCVMACFNDWLGTYGTSESLEESEILQKIISFIQANEHSGRFIKLGLGAMADGKFFNNVVGYVSTHNDRYYLYEHGLNEIIKPYNLKFVVELLNSKGYLICNHGKKFKVRIENAVKNMYAIDVKLLHHFDDK